LRKAEVGLAAGNEHEACAGVAITMPLATDEDSASNDREILSNGRLPPTANFNRLEESNLANEVITSKK
jgi:hypothetical protein